MICERCGERDDLASKVGKLGAAIEKLQRNYTDDCADDSVKAFNSAHQIESLRTMFRSLEADHMRVHGKLEDKLTTLSELLEGLKSYHDHVHDTFKTRLDAQGKRIGTTSAQSQGNNEQLQELKKRVYAQADCIDRHDKAIHVQAGELMRYNPLDPMSPREMLQESLQESYRYSVDVHSRMDRLRNGVRSFQRAVGWRD